MPAQQTPKFVQLDFGPLPVDLINRATGLELEPGNAFFSINAQKHAAKRHPLDYSRCLPHVAAVIADPMYLGDDFNNRGKIELVARIAALGNALLVAVEVTKDDNGRYNITSFYPISQKKIDNRREKGRLLVVKKH